MTKTMKEVTYEFIKKEGEVTFDKIWEYVKNHQQEEWNSKYKIKASELDKIKIGELYSLLTLEGTFTKKDDTHWVLTEELTYEELMASKITVAENNE